MRLVLKKGVVLVYLFSEIHMGLEGDSQFITKVPDEA